MGEHSFVTEMKDLIENLNKKVDGILIENEDIKDQIHVLNKTVNQQQIIHVLKKNNSDFNKQNEHSNEEDSYILHVTTENDAITLHKQNYDIDIINIEENDIKQTESRNTGNKKSDDTSGVVELNFQSLAKSFIASSSLHGLSRLADSSLWVRILWVLAMAGSITALVIQVNGLTQDYLKYSVITDVTLEQRPLTFPAVTVCNNRPFSAKKLLSLPLFSNMSSNIDDTSGSFLSEEFLKSQHELTLEDLLYLGTNVSNTLIVYTYPEDMAKVRTLKYKGSCFTIEVPPGTEFMAFLFNLHLNDSLIQYNPEPGIVTFLKDSVNGSYEYGHSHPITTKPGKQTYTEITHDVVKRLNESYGQCQDNEPDFTARTGLIYEQDACQIECKFRNIISKCQCLFSFHQYFSLWPRHAKDALPICNDSPYSCAFNATKDYTTCLCKPRCHLKLYKQIMQSTNDLENVNCENIGYVLPIICFLFTKMFPANSSKDWNKTNFAASFISLSKKPYNTFTQRPAYPLLHFLADVGGTLGFYLGASMLTYFELVHLLVSMSLHLRQAVRRKKKTSSNQNKNLKLHGLNN